MANTTIRLCHPNAPEWAGGNAMPGALESVPNRRGRPLHPSCSEHIEQKTLVSWWNLNCTKFGLPEHILFAIPNGGARNAVTGARLRDEGVRRGVPDLMLAVPNDTYSGLFIEMKRSDGGTTSKHQDAVIQDLQSRGYHVVICHGWEEAWHQILVYLAMPRVQTNAKLKANGEQL